MHLVFILKLKVSKCLEEEKTAFLSSSGLEKLNVNFFFYYFKEDTMHKLNMCVPDSLSFASFTIYFQVNDILLLKIVCLFDNFLHLSSHLSHLDSALSLSK